ncbi:MAG TPA: NADH-quinone oxidoreductase subunit C [Planctomycetota bacterium]|nr:NADH-quinone oxidoreductase subunit C [Planctomycetota bacterium]
MDFDAIYHRTKTRFPALEAPPLEAGERICVLPSAEAHAVLKFLKEDPELHFDSLMTLAGADTGKEFWVVYPLHSMTHRHRFLCKVVLPRDNPECDSVVDLWAGANFFEREAFDLYGIKFRNHPDLRRIINPPDWEGWPGRKDYQFPREYHGIETEREDQFFQEQINRETKARELAARRVSEGKV